MDKSSKIFVAGSYGLVGHSLVRNLEERGYTDIIQMPREKLDLCNQSQVNQFFESEKPEVVFQCAGRVGGVYANEHYRADFIYENTLMNCNLIHAAFVNNVKKLINYSCSSVYPKKFAGEFREDDLLSGRLEGTSEAFALSKILAMKMAESYNSQYGTDFVSLIPTNVYGPQQKYHAINSPVIPALLLKCHEAKLKNKDQIEIWGTGDVVRDFLFVDDLVDASLYILEKYMGTESINIGTGQETSIKDVALKIKAITGFKGEFIFDEGMPGGVQRKTQNLNKLNELGWKPKVSLDEGLELTYKNFLSTQ